MLVITLNISEITFISQNVIVFEWKSINWKSVIVFV